MIRFRGSGQRPEAVYSYSGVLAQIAAGLIVAASLGTYFRRHIREGVGGRAPMGKIDTQGAAGGDAAAMRSDPAAVPPSSRAAARIGKCAPR